MAELDSILKKYVNVDASAEGVLRAAAFVVKERTGKTLYSNACGKLNFDPESPDFTTDSVCRIASMSKLVTAISAMQLVEKKLIGLDEDVAKYVPELANKDILKGFEDDSTPILARQTKQMSLRTLLTHSSGFAYDNFDPNILKWSASVGRTVDSGSMTKEGYTFPLIFEPGEGWMYGVGLDWAGHVVSVLSHCTLDEYIQKNICQVLGMSSTTFAISERPDLASRRARLAFRAAPRGPLAPDENPMPEPPAMYSGGAGLFSTVKDYTKLLSVLMEEDGSILTKESIRELFKPQFDAQMAQQLQFFFDGALHEVACPEYPRGTPVNHALGGAVNLEDIPGTRRKGSMMWSGSTNGHWWVDLDTGVAAAMFTQVHPMGDSVAADLYVELEKAVYRDLVGGKVSAS